MSRKLRHRLVEVGRNQVICAADIEERESACVEFSEVYCDVNKRDSFHDKNPSSDPASASYYADMMRWNGFVDTLATTLITKKTKQKRTPSME
jgi:hypothetical protein